MKIECVKEKLLQAVSKAEKITGKNVSLPVLSCILLEAKNGTLKLKATNLDMGIEIIVPAKVDEEGVLAVPGTILNNLLSGIVEEKNVQLSQDGDNLLVSTGRDRFSIKTMPVDDFPSIPAVDDGNAFEIPANEFIRGLKSVSFSCSESSVKPELGSICIFTDNKEMYFVATDSFRLAEKKIKIKSEVEISNLLVPIKNVSDIIKVIDETKDDLKVVFNKNQISFVYNSLHLVSRVVDGNFPDYKQIIPKEFKTEAVVLKQDFLNALRLANVFSDSFKQINIKVIPKDKTIILKTRNSNVGESSNSLTAHINGEEIEINFNSKYITDCFGVLAVDSIGLEFNGLNRPLVIKGVSDKSFTYIVMPMNK
ncbi:MAG: DNA polymerase III subunit beta [bacterium]